MRTRLSVLPLAACIGLLLCASASAALVGIWRNELDTTAQRTELRKLTGRSCLRGGAEDTLKITIGKRTEECVYRTPVVGRNLEIAATERLLTGTPKAIARKAFLGLVLRAGGGARYELRVFPQQRKTQLVRTTEEGSKVVAVEKGVTAVKGMNEANVLRLSAIGAKGKVKVTAYIGSTPVGESIDEGAAEIKGESSGISVGAPKNGHGAIATFDALVVRAPVRF